jgi:hypothetical protein
MGSFRSDPPLEAHADSPADKSAANVKVLIRIRFPYSTSTGAFQLGGLMAAPAFFV